MNILEKSIKNRKDRDNWVFYDGPATANGMPGVHHMMAKILKDTFCKYKTMQGYQVYRRCHRRPSSQCFTIQAISY